jgi:hypothetical protein
MRRFILLFQAALFFIAGCYVMTGIGGNSDGSLVAVCPPDIDAAALAEVGLAGGVLPAGSAVAYAWDLAGKPEGSSAEPPQPRNGQISHFIPDVVGVYTVKLIVMGETGESSSCRTRATAAGGEGLHVELFWNPPEKPEDHSNADLHLLHQDAPYWFHYLLDCHRDNCTPFSPRLDWDAPGPEGDPSLDLHDSEGFGPEVIDVPAPVTGNTYTVGVHYYQGNGLDEADIFVRIFCGTGSTQPAFDAGPIRMRDYGGGTDGNDFWKAAAVTWEGGTCSVAPIDEMVLALAAMYER